MCVHHTHVFTVWFVSHASYWHCVPPSLCSLSLTLLVDLVAYLLFFTWNLHFLSQLHSKLIFSEKAHLKQQITTDYRKDVQQVQVQLLKMSPICSRPKQSLDRTKHSVRHFQVFKQENHKSNNENRCSYHLPCFIVSKTNKTLYKSLWPQSCDPMKKNLRFASWWLLNEEKSVGTDGIRWVDSDKNMLMLNAKNKTCL